MRRNGGRQQEHPHMMGPGGEGSGLFVPGPQQLHVCVGVCVCVCVCVCVGESSAAPFLGVLADCSREPMQKGGWNSMKSDWPCRGAPNVWQRSPHARRDAAARGKRRARRRRRRALRAGPGVQQAAGGALGAPETVVAVAGAEEAVGDLELAVVTGQDPVGDVGGPVALHDPAVRLCVCGEEGRGGGVARWRRPGILGSKWREALGPPRTVGAGWRRPR